MNRGKYSSRRKAKPNKRSYILLASLILVLGLGIGATAAYLAADSVSVTNTFTPAQIEVEVQEEFSNNVKTNIGAQNTSDVKAYVRITLVEYWMKGGDIVAKPDGGSVTQTELNADWIQANGIYYYTKPLASGAAATAINQVTATVPEGYTYHLDVYAEAIQAEPTDAVKDAWKAVLDGTTITGIGSGVG